MGAAAQVIAQQLVPRVDLVLRGLGEAVAGHVDQTERSGADVTKKFSSCVRPGVFEVRASRAGSSGRSAAWICRRWSGRQRRSRDGRPAGRTWSSGAPSRKRQSRAKRASPASISASKPVYVRVIRQNRAGLSQTRDVYELFGSGRKLYVGRRRSFGQEIADFLQVCFRRRWAAAGRHRGPASSCVLMALINRKMAKAVIRNLISAFRNRPYLIRTGSPVGVGMLIASLKSTPAQEVADRGHDDVVDQRARRWARRRRR